MPPYKRQVIAGEIPEVKTFDTSRMLDSAARTGAALSEATARLAEQNFQNSFEIESRRLLAETYELNKTNPKQLALEQEKIRVNLLKNMPGHMRAEAQARLAVHGAPYVQKAKENLYRQTFEEAQASTWQYINDTINLVQNNASALYGDDIAASGASIAATMADIDGVIKRIGTPDEEGNFHLTPQQRILVQGKLNAAITLGARNYFDGLDAKGKVLFAKEYERKGVEINVLDPQSPTGFGKKNISGILDREAYEENRKYFKAKSLEAQSDLLLEESLNPLQNPKGDLYKAIDYVNGAKEVPFEARKAASDILYAQISRDNQVRSQMEERDKARVLNDANGFMLEGNVRQAIQLVRNSSLDNTTKYEIIENFKKGRAASADDPDTYNSLAQGIVDGSIYNPSQVLTEYGKGRITDSSKNSLLHTLEQKQKPSFEIFKRANTQVQKVFDKGLMGMMSPAESAAMTYTLREISTLYQQALASGMSEREIEDILSPEKVNEIALKWQPGIKENTESYLKRVAPAEREVPAAKPGQSIEDYLKETSL